MKHGKTYALAGRVYPYPCTQGDALGWELSGLSGCFYLRFSLLPKLE